MRVRRGVYGLLAVFVAAGLAATAYLKRVNVHDYSARRTPRESVVEISRAMLAESLRHSFAFRILPSEDDRPRVGLQSGMCLLAHRAQTGEEVTSADRIVQFAVIELWRAPRMQEFARDKVDELWREYRSRSDEAPTKDELARMTDAFVADLWQLDDFETTLHELLQGAADGLEQTLRWTDDEGS